MVKLVSTTYRGEWPAGVYWSPGEVREVPTAEGAPVGVEPVADAVLPAVVAPAVVGKPK